MLQSPSRFRAMEDQDLQGSDFSGQTLQNIYGMYSDFRHSDFSGCEFGPFCSFTYADFRHSNFKGVRIFGFNVNFQQANFQGVDLSGVDFGRAMLCRADFSGANLRGAILDQCTLWDTQFEGADLTGTCLDPTIPLKPVDPEDPGLFTLDIDGLVLGYRTGKGNLGRCQYALGQRYEALWFSHSRKPEHPGLHVFPTLEQLSKSALPGDRDCGGVVVRFRETDLHEADYQSFRVRAFEVVDKFTIPVA